MSNITVGEVTSKLEEILALASTLDPRIALATAGYEALKDLFSKTGELSTLMGIVYSETAETAPEVAQAVSDYFTDKGEAMLASFRAHPGK